MFLRKIKLPLSSRQSSFIMGLLERSKRERQQPAGGAHAWRVTVQGMGRRSGNQFRGEAPPAGSHTNHFQPPLPHRLNLNITALVSGCHWGNDFRARWPAAIFFPSAISLLEVVKGSGKGRLGPVLTGRGGCCLECGVLHRSLLLYGLFLRKLLQQALLSPWVW